MKLIRKVNKGQSLFEVIVAIAISALIITAIVAIATNTVRNSTYSKNESLASDYAQQLSEWLRTYRDQDIQQFLTYVDSEAPYNGSSTWCLPVLQWTSPSRATYGTTPICDSSLSTDKISDTSFVREATFTPVHPTPASGPARAITIINVDIVVRWTDSQGDHKVVNSSSLSDWRQR